MNIAQRQKEFYESLSILNLDFKSQYSFGDVLNPYLNRPYHNLEHIERCLKDLDRYDLSEVDQSTLVVAIWFHDLIYDTKSHSNEFDSASQLYSMLICYKKDNSIFNTLVDIVLATRYRPTDHNLRFTLLQLIIRRCDLASLLDDIENVVENDKLVRKEFEHVCALDWYYNRPVFLRQLVQTEPFGNDEENQLLKESVEELIRRNYS